MSCENCKQLQDKFDKLIIENNELFRKLNMKRRTKVKLFFAKMIRGRIK